MNDLFQLRRTRKWRISALARQHLAIFLRGNLWLKMNPSKQLKLDIYLFNKT